MVKGAFHSFTHHHDFQVVGNQTVMLDSFTYESPLGLLGKVADKLFLKRYMTDFLRERAEYLKQAVEKS